MDHIFSFRIVEKILAKGKKLCTAFMDLKKAYDKVAWLALWDVLKIYGVGGKLLSAIKFFCEKASACVKISGETSEHFEIKVCLRQGCVMSPWLFNIYMDGVMREMKGKIGEVGVRMLKDRVETDEGRGEGRPSGSQNEDERGGGGGGGRASLS